MALAHRSLMLSLTQSTDVPESHSTPGFRLLADAVCSQWLGQPVSQPAPQDCPWFWGRFSERCLYPWEETGSSPLDLECGREKGDGLLGGS